LLFTTPRYKYFMDLHWNDKVGPKAFWIEL
jgi:hypothetical protein